MVTAAAPVAAAAEEGAPATPTEGDVGAGEESAAVSSGDLGEIAEIRRAFTVAAALEAMDVDEGGGAGVEESKGEDEGDEEGEDNDDGGDNDEEMEEQEEDAADGDGGTAAAGDDAEGGAEETGAASGAGEVVCPPGMDPEVFAQLPPDMQQEVIREHRSTVGSMVSPPR